MKWEDVKWFAGLLVAAAMGAVPGLLSYGALKAEVAHMSVERSRLDTRIDRVEISAAKADAEHRAAMAEVQRALTQLQVTSARICAAVPKCRE